MIIKVDMRESSLIECLRKNCDTNDVVNIKVEALKLGDCIIEDDSGIERTIIERKTLKDLAASIRDGRYNEQSFRLNECSVHNHNIIYLIEGDLDLYIPQRPNISKDALLSSFITLNFYKGFSLHRTKNIAETANWIYHFANKLAKKSGLGHFENSTIGENTTNQSYSEVIKRTKKACVTTDNIGEIMLSQIPNVSMAIAICLMEHFGNVGYLTEVLKNNPHSIESIVIKGKTGKTRKISKSACENIYRFLVGDVRKPLIEDGNV